MDTTGKILGAIVGVIGILSFIAAVLVYYLVPQRGIQALREDQKDLREKIADRDRESAQFRAQRSADVERLARDEQQIRELDHEVRDLRAWRYGAALYIRRLRADLRKHGGDAGDPTDYGLNGDLDDDLL